MSERRATVLRIGTILAIVIAVGAAMGAVLGKYGDQMGISGGMRSVLIAVFATAVGRTVWLLGRRAPADRRPDRKVGGESQHRR